VEPGETQCLRLPRRSFQDEVDDRERSDYYGDDDDDPDADGSDHPTTPRHHRPPTRLCETLTRTGLEFVVSRQLGHASIAITADVDGHPDDKAASEAAEIVGG
jgi:hypothetical protein